MEVRSIGVAAILISLMGCSTTPGKFGGGNTYTPTWDRFTTSAVNAAKDPGTWIPLTGAAIMLASGQDGSLTQDALHKNPVFGSKDAACDKSDEFVTDLDVVWLGTIMAADSGEFGTKQWASNKTTGLFTEIAILDASHFATDTVKHWVWRREPDPDLKHVEHEGFPSGHATPPFTQVALIRRNLEWVNAPQTSKYVVITGSYLLASSAAYARVEAGLHHYSDQFAGAALGNWIGLTLHDTFMERSPTYLGIVPLSDGAMVTMYLPF